MLIRMRCYERVVEDRVLDISEDYCERLTKEINERIVGGFIATLTPDEAAAIYTGDYEDEETERRLTRTYTFRRRWNEAEIYNRSIEDWVHAAIDEDLWDSDAQWIEDEVYDTETELIR